MIITLHFIKREINKLDVKVNTLKALLKEIADCREAKGFCTIKIKQNNAINK